MAKKPTVKVAISAEVKGAIRKLKKFGREMISLRQNAGAAWSGIRGSFRMGIKAIKGASTAISGLAMVSGVAVRGLHKQAVMLDELAKSARRAGVGIEYYQELWHVAELSGVNRQSFDRAMVKFTRNIGELKMGQGTLSYFLERANPKFRQELIDAEATGGMPAALNMLLVAMGKLPRASQRGALAANAFGRAGQMMTLMLENGTEAFIAQRAEARKLGLITTEQGKIAEDYIDAKARMDLALNTLKGTIAARVLPVMHKYVEALTGHFKANKRVISQGFEKTFHAIAKGARAAAEGIDWLMMHTAEGVLFWQRETPYIVAALRRWSDGIRSLVDSGVHGFSTLGTAIGLWWRDARVVFGGFHDIATRAFRGVKRAIHQTFGALWSFYSGFVSVVTLMGNKLFVEPAIAVVQDIRKAYETLNSFFGGLWDGIKSIFQTGVDSLLKQIERLVGALEVFDEIRAAFGIATDTAVSAEKIVREGPAGGPQIALKNAFAAFDPKVQGEIKIQVEAAPGTRASVDRRLGIENDINVSTDLRTGQRTVGAF